MKVEVRRDSVETEELSPSQQLAVKAVSSWVAQLGRTLKTCRLYDAKNPTVVRFREEFGLATVRLLAEVGTVSLRFTSDDVLYEDQSLYPARSRDDNLALAFHRDGVRGLTLVPGVEPREIAAILDAVLAVSGQNPGDDDLVTLLWEAHLPHIEIDYVPGDSDVGGSIGEMADDEQMVPWPTDHNQVPDEAEEASVQVADAPEGEEGDHTGRSDDWTTGELTAEIEAGYEELEALAPAERQRFLVEYQSEHKVSPVTTALAIVGAYASGGTEETDRHEIGRFVPRLLRLAIARGAWLEAREALALLARCAPPDWSVDGFTQELFQPISISSMVEHIDQQEPAQVVEFISLAKTLGDPGIDWLNLVLGESQQRRNRRLLAEALAEMCRDKPERLAPYLSDPRWYLVRNVVHILGWIGGPQIVGMMQNPSRHPEPRVRLEVVAALGRVEPKLARPLLLRMLDRADPRLFVTILGHLSAERTASVAALLLGFMLAPDFEQRPFEEKRAIYSALGACGTDDVVPELEGELLKANWFSRQQELHRNAVARCLARIGTPLSRTVLERGMTSRRAPVRKACEEALTGAPEADPQ